MFEKDKYIIFKNFCTLFPVLNPKQPTNRWPTIDSTDRTDAGSSYGMNQYRAVLAKAEGIDPFRLITSEI